MALLPLILSLISLISLASAQGVRSLGMGGLVLPGPGAADLNPAYAAYPRGFSEGETLPLGLLRLLPLFPETSPFTYWTNPQAFRSGFDALSFYDQLGHLNSFLFNPTRSPDEVVFRIRSDRIQVTDGQGNPLNPNFQMGESGANPTALYPAPLFWLPLQGGGFSLKVGPFVGVEGLSVFPSPELAQALIGNNLNNCKQTPSPCTLTLQGKASGGVALALSWASALPQVEGVGGVYLGVKGEGFYGLFYAETTASARPVFDQNGQPTGVAYEARGFYAYPGRGNGYGLRADFGVALELEEAVLGLGVQNLLGYALWQGYTFQTDQSGAYSEAPETRSSPLFFPSFFVNGAYRFKDLGLLVGADARFGSTAFTAHLGGEYALGPARLRAGIGYESGLRFGVGAGFELGQVGLDLALTAHEAPLVGGGGLRRGHGRPVLGGKDAYP